MLMEALQMLKYTLNNSSTGMNFTADLLTAEADLIMDTNIDLLANLMSATGDLMRENAMDRIIMEIDEADSADAI